MLELTLATGTELKIGEDIRIVFRGDTVGGRLKVAVELPKKKGLRESKRRKCKRSTGRLLL